MNCAYPRKKRNSQAIEKSEQLFTEAISNKNYKKAGLAVLWCVFKDFGKEGILNALDNANSFMERKRYLKNI